MAVISLELRAESPGKAPAMNWFNSCSFFWQNPLATSTPLGFSCGSGSYYYEAFV